MNFYHQPFETDAQALAARDARSVEVGALGGGCYVALSHGHGPAYLVVYLPASYQGDAFGKPIYTEPDDTEEEEEMADDDSWEDEDEVEEGDDWGPLDNQPRGDEEDDDDQE